MNNINNNSNTSFSSQNNSELLSPNYPSLLTSIKLTILRLKLNLLSEIFTHHLKRHFLHFLWKSSLKGNLQSLFHHSDNFLHMFPTDRPCIYKSIYSHRRLSYVIKSFKYRHTYLLRNAFFLWKQQANVFSLILIPKKESKRKRECFNFISTLTKVIMQHQVNVALYTFAFLKWVTWSMRDDICEARFTRAAMILRNVVNRRLMYVFAMMPRDYLYVKGLSERMNGRKDIMYYAMLMYRKEEMEVKGTKRRVGLLKILMRNNLKMFVNKRVYCAFRKLRMLTNTYVSYDKENANLNEMLLDLKCDSLLNGILLLKILLSKHYISHIQIYKRTFFSKLLTKVQIANTLHEYALKYKQIPQMLNNSAKIDLLLIRNEYQKAYALKRICIIRSKYKYMNATPYSNIGLLKLYKKGCFYQWKGLIYNLEMRNRKQQFAMNLMFYLLCQKFYYNTRYLFITNLIIHASISKLNVKYRNDFIKNFIYEIAKCFLYKKAYVFYMLVNSYCNKKLLTNQHKTIGMYLYTMRKRFNKYKLNTSYSKWKIISSSAETIHSHSNENVDFDMPIENNILPKPPTNTVLPQQASSSNLINNNNDIDSDNDTEMNYLMFSNPSYLRLSKLLSILYSKLTSIYRTSFHKWKQNSMHTPPKPSPSININQMIINNMSTILLSYENEDTKLKHELSKMKTSLRLNTLLIHIVLSKHNFILLKSMSKWLRNSCTQSSYAALLSKYENLKKENDALIEVYYDKKSQYKKTIADYEYMKKHYCSECMGDEIEIDYKSVNNEVYDSGSICESDMHVESEDECNRVHINGENTENGNEVNEVNKIAEKENLIKEYQNEYSQQLKYYEEYINTMSKKKEELLAMKQMLLLNTKHK